MSDDSMHPLYYSPADRMIALPQPALAGLLQKHTVPNCTGVSCTPNPHMTRLQTVCQASAQPTLLHSSSGQHTQHAQHAHRSDQFQWVQVSSNPAQPGVPLGQVASAHVRHGGKDEHTPHTAECQSQRPLHSVEQEPLIQIECQCSQARWSRTCKQTEHVIS